MKVDSKKSVLSGSLVVPGSKSHTIRALILATMSNGVSHISNPLQSNDCLSTAAAARQIGAEITFDKNNVWTVYGAGKKLHLPQTPIDVGNSGSLMYFLCPILSTLSGECTFTGDESICKRPVSHLIDALNQLGAKASCLENESTPPFKFCGPIDVNKKLVTEGALSQYISGFMMAASRMKGDLKISLKNPKETPYLTMTKLWLEKVGVNAKISSDFKEISVHGPVEIKAFDETVPSDWEGVAFPLIAALISESKIVINNVDGSGSQGDDRIVEVLQSVGADIVWDKKSETLTVCGGKKLSTAGCENGVLKIDISSFPDAICALSTIACFIEGTTILTDVEICRKKETDRVKAMICELSKLGCKLEEKDNCLIIHGVPREQMKGGCCESYKDHRIAMSLACFGLGLKEDQVVTINDAECCSVSFPHFYEEMNKIGAGFVCRE